MKKKIILEEGVQYKCFIFIKELSPRYTPKGAKVRYAKVRCLKCNKEVDRSIYNLTSSREAISCGCYNSVLTGKRFRTHGKRNTRLYKIWCGIKERTLGNIDIKTKDYKDRGITICEEWSDDFMLFYNWSMNNGYKDSLSIDRRDNDGSYNPSNCRWSNRLTQQHNKRHLSKANKSGYKGVCWDKDHKKWTAQITYTTEEGKTVCKKLKRHKDKLDAAKAFDKFVIENNLPNSLNFPKDQV